MKQPLLSIDDEALARFGRIVIDTYGGMLVICERGGIVTGDFDQATLLARLVLKMLVYKEERAAELVTGGAKMIAETDAEIADIWPVFQAFLDDELAEAKEIMEKLKADERRKMH